MKNSFIKDVLMEADEFSLAPEAPAPAPVDAGITPQAAAAAVTPTPAPAPTTGFPQFPGSSDGQAVVNKQVLNKELILTIFSEMKSLIANSEKRLSADEIPISDAQIAINSLLSSLAFNANKLHSLVNNASGSPVMTPPVENGMTTPAAGLPSTPPPPPPMTEPAAAIPPMPELDQDINSLEL